MSRGERCLLEPVKEVDEELGSVLLLAAAEELVTHFRMVRDLGDHRHSRRGVDLWGRQVRVRGKGRRFNYLTREEWRERTKKPPH